jgi:aldehyde:ferredoxin oxidoreductase
MKLGLIVRVDLSKRTVEKSPYPEDAFGGLSWGRGYNVAYLYRHLSRDVKPLDPENILILSCGLLTGTAAPSASRTHINALSPETGLLGSSNVGGHLGADLRLAGIQCLIITGKAAKPSYLLIHENQLEILEAGSLWGLDTWETRERIQQAHHGENVSILTIGPAGENLVPFACIMAGRDHAGGRTGMGAVLGSKLLKAIVVKKTSHLPKAANTREQEAIGRYIRLIKQSPEFKTFSTYGGAGYVKWADDMGILGTLNYRSNHFDAADRIDGRNLLKYKTKSTGCYRCPIQCKAELSFQKDKDVKTRAVRPEFESMVSLGSKCGVDDPKEIVHLDNLCSRLGIDTISAGSVLAFAMDLFDRGILTRKDTGQTAIRWGDSKVMQRLIRGMAYREGFGGLLALGIREAASVIGRGAEHYALQVKGLELSAYHPYFIMGTALSYAVSTRGGDFNDFFPSLEYIWSPERAAAELGNAHAVELSSIEGKGALVKRAMLVNFTLDCLGLCKVPSQSLIRTYDLGIEADLAAHITGLDLTPEKLYRMSERVAHLERLFNIRYGLTAEDDRLPEIFFEKEGEDGEPRGGENWLKPMVQDFYHVMGWNEAGVPEPRTLQDFEIEPLS